MKMYAALQVLAANSEMLKNRQFATPFGQNSMRGNLDETLYLPYVYNIFYVLSNI